MGIPGAGSSVGNTGDVTAAKATTRSGKNDKPNPILDVLKKKELPETKTTQPVFGLLYFPMEKQKVKDLELRYNVPDDKIVMHLRAER